MVLLLGNQPKQFYVRDTAFAVLLKENEPTPIWLSCSNTLKTSAHTLVLYMLSPNPYQLHCIGHQKHLVLAVVVGWETSIPSASAKSLGPPSAETGAPAPCSMHPHAPLRPCPMGCLQPCRELCSGSNWIKAQAGGCLGSGAGARPHPKHPHGNRCCSEAAFSYQDETNPHLLEAATSLPAPASLGFHEASW